MPTKMTHEWRDRKSVNSIVLRSCLECNQIDIWDLKDGPDGIQDYIEGLDYGKKANFVTVKKGTGACVANSEPRSQLKTVAKPKIKPKPRSKKMPQHTPSEVRKNLRARRKKKKTKKKAKRK